MPDSPSSPQTASRSWSSRLGLAALALLVLGAAVLALRGRQLYVATLYPDNPLDFRVAAPRALVVGGTNVVHCAVLDRRRGAGLAGVRIEAAILPQDGPEVPAGAGTTDGEGTLDLQMDGAAIRRGPQRLRVRLVSSPLGPDEVVLSLSGERPARLLLTCDKPLYQPDQVIHLRALAMDTAAGRPISGESLTFEVEDPKGNKVFRRSAPTSRFGIASADFRLAEEVNLGAFKLRAQVGDLSTEKTATVSRYVLPKYKLELATTQAFYLAGQTLHGSVDANYFFGKPVAGGEVAVDVGTFVERFDSIAVLRGKTDAAGHFDFELKLPGHFVGLPLEKGNALLKLEAKVTDTAQHAEAKTATRIVAREAIQLQVVHESGIPVPGIENRYYVSTSYPDGRPARATVTVAGPERAHWTFQTSEAGIGILAWTPPAVNPRGYGYRPGGGAAAQPFTLEARDTAGQVGHGGFDPAHPVLAAEDQQNWWQPDPKRVGRGADGTARFLLRTDKALYRAGETAHLSLVAAAEGGRYTVDLVRGGQTCLTKLVKATGKETPLDLDLDTGLAGTLYVQAYRLLPDGNWARDRRVIYVDQPKDLELTATLDRETYKPGESAKVSFAVRAAGGAAEPAALSLSVVDEAVFALSENQPGLEKVYFSLEKEILEPKYQVKCAPVSVPELVRAGGPPPPPPIQEAAAAALAALELPEESAPVTTYQKRMDEYQSTHWEREHALREFMSLWFTVAVCTLPVLLLWLLPGVCLWKSYRLGRAIDWWVGVPAAIGLAFLVTWLFPERHRSPIFFLGALGLIFLGALLVYGQRGFRARSNWGRAGFFVTLLLGAFLFAAVAFERQTANLFRRSTNALSTGSVAKAEESGVFTGLTDAVPVPAPGGEVQGRPMASLERRTAGGEAGADRKSSVRVREYFPETLFWLPQLLTDDDGRAVADVPLADSITTWRMSVQGVSAAGRLGGLDRGIRVFQDFFVDIDLPVSLTDGDEVHVPVAIYNYLKEPQTVELELEAADWFLGLDEPKKKVELAAGEVTSVRFGLRARRFGLGKLTVYAFGSKGFKDAVRRSVRVLPNGEEREASVGNRLAAGATETLRIPEEAIDGASSLLFKLYPGTFSQVMDGLERLVQMPYG